MSEKEGKLFVITGPSGVGKGTLVRSLLKSHPQLFVSISATTRKPRQGEKEGKDYYFLSQEQFKSMIEEDNLLEWATYAGNYYGTPKQPVLEKINQGKTIILEIELLGARQVKENLPQSELIFILPPSEQELERRLRNRGSDSPEAISKRLQRAKEEILAQDEFDHKIVNDQLERAIVQLQQIII
ncbi:guanylate kinase [Cyanobacterium stanieri LEGE 03274]|uniref:Guanylate kinase n=1 Tax=Cyanobacterium stanieri LEGE 03274 TaxID=1828756 RepID=A0ABR9V2M4_9CHRO|nr:guanylate kinase [Cyanobacterium stanieri]MBE9222146.1 guanylate kinase [Cyanobacterium stanieri LEGE 03274]